MTGSSFPFVAISLFVTNIMLPYVVLDPCVQLWLGPGLGISSLGAVDRSRIRSISMEDVDLLTGMGNGDSRLNIVKTKYSQ